MSATITPIFRWRNRGTERLMKPPVVMEPENVRTGIRTLNISSFRTALNHLTAVLWGLYYYYLLLSLFTDGESRTRGGEGPTLGSCCEDYAPHRPPGTQFPNRSAVLILHRLPTLIPWHSSTRERRNWGLERLKDSVKVGELAIDKVILK